MGELRYSILPDIETPMSSQNDQWTINLGSQHFLTPNAVHASLRRHLPHIIDSDVDDYISLSPQQLNNDYTCLNNDLRLPEGADANTIRRSAMAYHSYFFRHRNKRKWQPSPCEVLSTKIPGLYVRYGIVELRCLENLLHQRNDTITVARYFASHPESIAHSSSIKSNQWLNVDDISNNLARLMTNAGFYTTNNTVDMDLLQWYDDYMTGLIAGTLLEVTNATFFFLELQRHLREHFGKTIWYRQIPAGRRLYDLISGQSVLFVTPLAELVNQQMRTGRLRTLYHTFVPPDFFVQAIPAFITTWPHAPHDGYSNTLRILKNQVDNELSRGSFDLFTASCGLYGIPLCHYVWHTYGITCLYLGNITHALFGIRQNATSGFLTSDRNQSSWIPSDLDKYAGLSLIDGGRYLS